MLKCGSCRSNSADEYHRIGPGNNLFDILKQLYAERQNLYFCNECIDTATARQALKITLIGDQANASSLSTTTNGSAAESSDSSMDEFDEMIQSRIFINNESSPIPNPIKRPNATGTKLCPNRSKSKWDSLSNKGASSGNVGNSFNLDDGDDDFMGNQNASGQQVSIPPNEEISSMSYNRDKESRKETPPSSKEKHRTHPHRSLTEKSDSESHRSPAERRSSTTQLRPENNNTQPQIIFHHHHHHHYHHHHHNHI